MQACVYDPNIDVIYEASREPVPIVRVLEAYKLENGNIWFRVERSVPRTGLLEGTNDVSGSEYLKTADGIRELNFNRGRVTNSYPLRAYDRGDSCLVRDYSKADAPITFEKFEGYRSHVDHSYFSEKLDSRDSDALVNELK